MRDEHHGNAGVAQSAEQSVGRAGNADHAGALEIHERNLIDAADAFDGRHARARRRRDLRAGMRRVEGIADPDRDAAADGGRHRLRVDDLRAEIRELHGLAVRHLVDDLGLGHLARVAAHDAVDVGPDVDLVGIEQRTEDRRGVVAAVTAQRRRQTVLVRRYETGDDGDPVEGARDGGGELRPRQLPIRDGPHLGMLDDEHVARVQEHDVAALTELMLEERGDLARRPNLPVAGNEIAAAVRRGAHERERLQDALDVCEVAVEVGHDRLRTGGAEKLQVRLLVTRAQRLQRCLDGLLLRRFLDEPEQVVSHAFHRRNDDGQIVTAALAADDVGHAADAARVGNTGAAELVHSPSHQSILWGSGFRRPRA